MLPGGVSVVPDEAYAGMWRVLHLTGPSDMVNRARPWDAAVFYLVEHDHQPPLERQSLMRAGRNCPDRAVQEQMGCQIRQRGARPTIRPFCVELAEMLTRN